MVTAITCDSRIIDSPSPRFASLYSPSLPRLQHPQTTSNDLKHTASRQLTQHRLDRRDIRTSNNPTMAPKRKAERKTGIHTLGDTPPSKKTKTTRTAPKANGLHTLTGSQTKSEARSSKAAPKQGLHTLADVSFGNKSTNSSCSGTSHIAEDEHDGDYVEDGATLDSDEDDLALGSSTDAHGTKGSNEIHEARERQVDTEGLKLGTRSQSHAAICHEEATRAKLMFLERLSRDTDKAVGKCVEAADSGTGGADGERGTEV